MWILDDESLDLPFTFLGLPEPLGDDSERVSVWPIPYESTTSYRSGTRAGPQAIIEASRYVETYDEERDCDLASYPVETLPGVGPILGAGDRMMERIERMARQIVRAGRMLIALGGEHSITAPLVRAHARVFGDLTVVQFDAHADLRDTYEGTRTSHASVMRRVAEVAPTLGIGVRSISAEEVQWLRSQRRSEVVFAHEMRRRASLVGERIGRLTGNVYLTVDLDVFDPALVPGVGTPEPGGMPWDAVVEAVAALAERTTIVGADVVELSPVSGSVVSEFVAAKLVAKIIACGFHPTERE